MKRLFLKIINLGTAQIENELEKAQTQIFNLSCLSGIFFPTFAALSFFLLGILELTHLQLCVGIDFVFIILLYLNAKGKHKLSSILVPVTCLIVVSLAFVIYGGTTEHELIFLAISISPFLFPSAKQWLRFMFMGLFMIAFLICTYISFPPFLEISPDIIKITNNHIYWIITGLLLYQIIALYHLYQLVIGDLVEKQKQVIQSKEKAEENDRLKSAFLTNISHEIRTPMNVVMGFSDQLLAKQVSEKERMQYAEMINSSSKRLLDIVDDILDLSKIETNQIEVENKSVNITQLLEELYHLFKQMAHKKGLHLYLNSQGESTNLYCITDEMKLRQILVNYLSNAIKYSKEGTIELGYQLFENDIEFHVKDTGIGIPKELQKAVFERFRQLENNMIEGTGLGLAISKGLAELLGGRVRLTSSEGKGSTFFLSIPYIPVSNSSKTNGERTKDLSIASVRHSEKKRILIAEDELFNFKLLEVIFKDLNVEIVWAKNGEEAIEQVKNSNTFDFILMDIKMPIMSGLEATK
ncbi:MAG: ATP-binding protein, partial [Bacteroidota bacterium]